MGEAPQVIFEVRIVMYPAKSGWQSGRSALNVLCIVEFQGRQLTSVLRAVSCIAQAIGIDYPRFT